LSSDRRNSNIVGCDDHVRLERNQLACELGKSFDRVAGEADVDENRFSVDVADLPQPQPERSDVGREQLTGCREEPDVIRRP
jgi:hypothetical protein